MAKGKRIYTGEEIKVNVYSTDEEIANVVNKRRYDDYYDWQTAPDDRDIVPRGVVQTMIDEGGGGGSAALTFNLTGADVVDEYIDLSGRAGMPALGSIPSAIRIYADDIDNSQSGSFTPSDQMLYTGLSGSETSIIIKITF